MIKKLLWRICSLSAASLLFASAAYAQSPTEAAKNFNIFTESGLTLVTNETEGPIACGGDLTIKGSYQVAIHNAGTFMVGNTKIGLLVNGKVNYTSGNSVQVQSNSYVKIGNNAGSTVWYYDQNNATPPIRITPTSGGYNGSPRIELQTNAPTLGVSVNNNPVFQGGLLDFATAFTTLRAKSSSISQCTGNAQITNPNGQSIPTTNLPQQIKINLADGINYFNITGADLNAAQNIIFNNQPSASKVLVVNVNAPGTFNWNVWNQGGIGFQNCPYILYNFYNTTQLNITSGNAIEGTVLAPFASVDKSGNQANLEGQVIAKSFIHSGGEVHYAVFSPTVTGCAPAPSYPPSAAFNFTSDGLCLYNNQFTAYNLTTVPGSPGSPVTYLWNFGDGTTSTAVNPTKVYSAAGTYTVTLTATNSYGSDTETYNVTVYPSATPAVVQATSATGQGSITKQFTLTNAAAFQFYTWSIDGQEIPSTFSQPVINYTFTQAGYYEIVVKGYIGGCSETTIVPVVIASEDVSTGNNGGLESESLGDALSKRYVGRKMKSIPTAFVKTDAMKFDKQKMLSQMNINTTGRNVNSQTMLEMFPTQLVAGDVSHVTSPTDILDYTVAQEVLSVDFEVGGKTKAVVLGVRTRDKVYNHTKASCDRLRGAEIMTVKTVQLEGYNFLMQAIKQRTGITEYAISFAVAKNNNDTKYTLQTNWFVKDYTIMNDMYNFQVWATTPESTEKLVKDILHNLEGFIPVEQTEIQRMPKTYATKVSREGTDMVLNLKSVDAGQNIEIVTEEIYSETNGYAMRYQPLTSETVQVVRMDIKDGYEYDGVIKVEGVTQDAFYHADGNWGLDYDGANTTINTYTVSNNFDRVYNENEHAVHRNVKLQAHSNQDYLTLYKSLLPGQLAADYTDHGFLSFKAKGSGLLEIGLVKAGITEWKHQYKAVINVRNKEAVYYIPFNFMKSVASNQQMTADDLTMITYTFLPVAAGTNDLDLTIEDVKFTKMAPDGYEDLLNSMVNQFVMFPNPSQGNINCLLYSEVKTTANVTVHDITGKLVHTAAVNLEEGRNELNFDFNHLNSGMFFFNVDSPVVNYGTSKIVIK
ncbi:MAG: collagen-binding domain-containing protein [Flavobacterium sp.]